jgi:MoxR-like ATPase
MQSGHEAANAIARITANIEQVIVGKADAISLSMIGILCNGHILIEDVPGVGKTVLSKALARSIGCSFNRIQCTPDLLPSDITGAAIYNPQAGTFDFQPGPIMSQIVLADELNRTTPKTQSALLEAMAESQVTVDSITYRLPHPFVVMATQNPLAFTGTFPLPEAQLDRFLLTISLGYPAPEHEIAMLDGASQQRPLEDLQMVLTAEDLISLQQQVAQVYVAKSIRAYIVAIVQATRTHGDVALGSSPRGSLALYRAAQARAAIEGRRFVVPDDITHLAQPILAHRVALTPEARFRGVSFAHLLEEILHKVPAPTGRADETRPPVQAQSTRLGMFGRRPIQSAEAGGLRRAQSSGSV